ncbi:MAG: precorrin-4 C(11)-methyltransferase [Thermodesulfobacteriota bacterium]|nr:precorrin-4 C(11)-methyltransferase [Thermodesulfobacteriota bacterium]
MTTLKYPIIFCGAGPGDPDLITVKGMRALAVADLVLYAGSLVPEAVLNWAPDGAQRVSSAGLDLDRIVACMAEAHHKGLRVVRLHTGDPSLYGATGEQMAALRERKIPYDVIPGVSAAFAAAAALGTEYTMPERTQTLILTRVAGRTPVPESENLAALARHGASMAIYLSMAQIEEVAQVLSATYGPGARCAVACRVSHPEEKIVFTRADELARTARDLGIDRLAVILVGPALEAPAALASLKSKLYDKDFTHGYRPKG